MNEIDEKIRLPAVEYAMIYYFYITQVKTIVMVGFHDSRCIY